MEERVEPDRGRGRQVYRACRSRAFPDLETGGLLTSPAAVAEYEREQARVIAAKIDVAYFRITF